MNFRDEPRRHMPWEPPELCVELMNGMTDAQRKAFDELVAVMRKPEVMAMLFGD